MREAFHTVAKHFVISAPKNFPTDCLSTFIVQLVQQSIDGMIIIDAAGAVAAWQLVRGDGCVSMVRHAARKRENFHSNNILIRAGPGESKK